MENGTSPLFVPVHYSNVSHLERFVASLSRASGFDKVRVLVVNNSAMRDDRAHIDRLCEVFPNVSPLHLCRNAGYFGGARIALNGLYAEQKDWPRWVAISNTDILFPDREIIRKLERQPTGSYGALGPRIRSLCSGRNQNPFMERRNGIARRVLYDLLLSCYAAWRAFHLISGLKGRMGSKSRAGDNCKDPAGPIPCRSVYALHGSFMVLSHLFFARGGRIDEEIFLFGEEALVAEECRCLDLPVIYDPGMAVDHNEHGSFRSASPRFVYDCNKAAYRFLKRKYDYPLR
jgi:GT2 family glycosyltransferase